ncbi:MAG TPA: DUF1156 domain-containing protein [Terracidiphilus sp.]|nr:DUF1156 domain-containing protein [Terracidiphilus sp.]
MKKKLIEVALPLDAINIASAREKSIRHGHPSTLHLWWARRPLATCRAVLFASLVDDPSSHPEQFPTPEAQEAERQRLFRIIERMVPWEAINDQQVLAEAWAEILKSTGSHPPAIYDPFCGGGSIPLEAQRLGLEARASDLNPVAVLITKALIEIPPKFANRAPINPEARRKGLGGGAYPGAMGLAEDVRYYGAWMRQKAEERIGHLYSSVRLPDASEATVVAWLWARTVKCPNPACGAEMPLVRTFALSTKKSKQAWVQPMVDQAARTVRFSVQVGAGTMPPATKTGRGSSFRCLVCSQTAADTHVKREAMAGRMSAKLLAVVAEGKRGRVYVDPNEDQERIAKLAKPTWKPQADMPTNPRWFSPPAFGMKTFGDLFTARQLVALTTFSDLVAEARSGAIADGASEDYADAIATYLAFALSKMADRGSSICTWFTERDSTRNTFARQAIPMTWDFAELNVLLDGTGSFEGAVAWTAESLQGVPARGTGITSQLDATIEDERQVVFSSDPPYYDNIGYADLSDFFYVWLRRSLHGVYPQLMSTLLVPKKQELVATPYRFEGGKDEAREFFEDGFGKAMRRMRANQHPDYPVTIYYAFKQSETEEDEDDDTGNATASTGWETMLAGLLSAGFQVTGTWPMRSELTNRPIASGTNALASSIILVCRPRADDASLTTRKDFLSNLKRELGPAIRTLQQGNIAPVDLQQAAIGPGMGIFSRYSKVIESDGKPMGVRTALGLINAALDEVLSEQESDYDRETRWSLVWFEERMYETGDYGRAEVLANAKGVSVRGVEEAGIIQSHGGKVRLLERGELDPQWDPATDKRITVWEVTQHLIHRLDQKGQDAAAELVARVGGLADTARELAYRLYTLCERKGWAQEAGYYNALVVAWPAIRGREFTLTGA